METENADCYSYIKHFAKLSIIASDKVIIIVDAINKPTRNSNTNSILTRQENLTNACIALWEHVNA